MEALLMKILLSVLTDAVSVIHFHLSSDNWAKIKLLSHILKEESFYSESMEVQLAMIL